MRDEDLHERPAGERTPYRSYVLRMSGTRVDQGGHGAVEEVSVVPRCAVQGDGLWAGRSSISESYLGSAPSLHLGWPFRRLAPGSDVEFPACFRLRLPPNNSRTKNVVDSRRTSRTSIRHVFALTNLPETVKGALFARYSRSAKSLRRLFLDEFADKDVSADAGGRSTVGRHRARRAALRAGVQRVRRRLGRAARRRAHRVRIRLERSDQGRSSAAG